MGAPSGLLLVPLPPYEPDGSLPPVPLEEVTAKDLIARYEVSKQTLYTRLAAVGVSGTKRGKQVFFNSEEVFRLDAGHHFLGKGYGLKDLGRALPTPFLLVRRWSMLVLLHLVPLLLITSRWN